MKCERHPETDAVGVCVSCGRGVCTICKLTYQGLIHCRECVETGRIGGARRPQPPPPPYQYPYYPYPYQSTDWLYRQKKAEPKGTPDPGMFTMAVPGCILSGIICFIMAPAHTYWFWGGIMEDLHAFALVASFVFLLTMLLVARGIYGFYRNFGSVWGIYGGVGLVLSLLVFLIMFMFIPITSYSYCLAGAIPYFSLGIGLILVGLSVDQARVYLTPERQRNGVIRFAAIGIIVTGVLFMTVVGAFILAWVSLAISLFLLAAEFHHMEAGGDSGDKKARDDFFVRPTYQDGEGEPVYEATIVEEIDDAYKPR